MKDKAYELYGWLQDAVAECAQGDLYPSKDWTKIENKADDLFNDAGTCRDLLGDRIFDACKGNMKDGKALELCNHLIDIGHTAVKTAIHGFIKDHNLSTGQNDMVVGQ